MLELSLGEERGRKRNTVHQYLEFLQSLRRAQDILEILIAKVSIIKMRYGTAILHSYCVLIVKSSNGDFVLWLIACAADQILGPERDCWWVGGGKG